MNQQMLRHFNLSAYPFTTGKSGTGKSCLIRLLLAELHTGLHKAIYLSHTSVGVQEFYAHIAAEIGLETAGRRATLYRAIHQRVLSLHKQSRIHTVLVLDEAHLLSNGVLKELRLLANYEIDSLNAMTILLCGQESLLQKFGLSALEPLANSITVSVATDGLPKEESIATATMMKAYHADSPTVEGEHVQVVLTR